MAMNNAISEVYINNHQKAQKRKKKKVEKESKWVVGSRGVSGTRAGQGRGVTMARRNLRKVRVREGGSWYWTRYTPA